MKNNKYWIHEKGLTAILLGLSMSLVALGGSAVAQQVQVSGSTYNSSSQSYTGNSSSFYVSNGGVLNSVDDSFTYNKPSGAFFSGIEVAANGQVLMTGGTISMSGDYFAGINGPGTVNGTVINENGSQLRGLENSSGSVLTGTNLTFNINSSLDSYGVGSYGVVTGGSGSINIYNSTFNLTGSNATGLVGSNIHADGVVINAVGTKSTAMSVSSGTSSIRNSTINVGGVNGTGFYTGFGGLINADNVTINVDSGNGVFTTSYGAKTNITNSTLNVNNGNGLWADDTSSNQGAFITGSNLIINLGTNAVGANSTNGGFVYLYSSTITGTGANSKGLAIDGNPGYIETNNTVISSTANSFKGAFWSWGGTMTLNNTSITTTGSDSYGFYIYSGGRSVLIGNNLNVLVTGNNSMGGVIGCDSGTSFLISSTIATTGSNSTGLQVGYNPPGHLVAQDLTVTTTGNNSTGVLVTTNNTTFTGTGVTIKTNGNASVGLQQQSTNTLTDLTNFNIETSGASSGGVTSFNGIMNLTSGTVKTAGNSSIGVNASGAGIINATNAAISTSGSNSHGAYASSGGKINFSGSNNVQTTSGGANGLYTSGSGSTITTNGGAIKINTSGNNASGAQADTNTSITLGNGSVINTSGSQSYGIFANGQNATVSGTNLNISTTGNNAAGVYAFYGKVTLDNGEVTTYGNNAHGVSSSNGAAEVWVNSSTVRTFGNGSDGLHVWNPVAQIHAKSADIATTGNYSNGAWLGSGAAMDLTDGRIVTSGSYSNGIYLYGGGVVVSAQNTNITTNGDSSYGVYQLNMSTLNMNGANIQTFGKFSDGIQLRQQDGNSAYLVSSTISNVQVSTKGDEAAGVHVIYNNSGPLNMTLANATINTTGSSSYGVWVDGTGSPVTAAVMNNSTVTTTGNSAHGVYVNNGGILNMGTNSVQTSGSVADGFAISGSGSDIKTNSGVIIKTTGLDAHGISVQNGATKTYDGTAGNQLPQVTVSGSGAAVLNAQGAGSQITLLNTALNTGMTLGVDTWGAKAEAGGTITFGDASATGGTGLWAADGGLINFIGSGSGNGSRTKVDAGGNFNISNSTVGGVTIGSLEGAGNVTLGNNTLTVGGYTTVADSTSTLFSGTISGAGSLIKQGVGALTLQGDSAFLYTGSTSIKDGIIAIRGLSNIPGFTKTVTLDGGWLDLSDSPGFSNPPEDGNNPNQWNNLTILSGSTAATGGVIGANDNITYNVTSGTETIVYHIGSSSVNPETYDKRGLYVVKTGDGTLVLTGSNAYMGNTRVENGILQVSQNANLGDTGANREVVLGNQTDASSSGTLQVAGSFTSDRRIELRQDGAIDANSGVSTTFGSVSADLNNVTHTLTKNGAGEIIISGQSDLAGLIVNGGHINLGSGANIDSGANSALFMNGGTATISGGNVQNSSGDLIVAQSGSASVLNLSNLMVNAGDANLINISNGSALTVNANNAVFNGDIITDASSTGNIKLSNNSVLTGMVDTVNMNIDGSSLWNMTANSSVGVLTNNGTIDYQYNAGSFKTLTANSLNGAGSFKMNTFIGSDVTPNHAGDLNGAGDLLVINGEAAGNHQIIIKIQGGNQTVNDGQLQLKLVETQQTSGSFQGSAGVGMKTAQVQRGDLNGNNQQNWYLVLSATTSGSTTPPNPPNPPDPTPVDPSQVVVGSDAARITAWFDQDTLVKRMGELRLNDGIFSDLKDHDWEAWVRSYGSQYNMGGNVTGQATYRQYVYGVDIGADKAWNIDQRNVLYTGVFGGYERSDLDFHYNGSDGGNNGYNMGVYASWLHDTGWYADWVSRAMYFDSNFKGYDDSANSTTGSYGSWAVGTSLELGRQFKFKDGWFAEPQVQASYVHFFGTNYQTGGDNQFGVNLHDGDAAQFRFGSMFGRTIKLSQNVKDKGFIQPYVKVFGMEQISNGNDITVTTDNGVYRANTDGMSAIIGAGLIYQIDETNQLHLDYEAQFADKYTKPFGINFGYRHQF